MRRIFIFLLSFFFFSVLFTGTSEHVTAQYGNSASLILTPEFPAPRSEVLIKLDAYTFDTSGATIQWYVNTVELIEYRNARNITLTVGELGEAQTVTAHITRTDSPSISATAEIIPSGIDLVIESMSYVPLFYKGRALPSTESTIRAIAIPHIQDKNKNPLYTYTWEYNGSVLLGGPVVGKSDITLAMPRYTGNVLSVTVRDEGGHIFGKRSVQLEPISPEFLFYEENPLRGLGQRALLSPHALTGEETTIHGMPYYMNTDLTPNTTAFEWRIDGSLVQSDGTDPNLITLRRMGGQGSALIELKALTKADIPQYLKKSFSVLFN